MSLLKRNLSFVLLLLITGFLSIGNLTTGHNWGGDFAGYIMQAQSILKGTCLNFIEANELMILHSSYPVGLVTYPWGFPLLLVPVYAVFGMNLLALKSVGMITFLCFLMLVWGMFRKYHSPVWHIGLVSLFALNPTFIGFLNEILSDFPFLLCSTFSVLLIGRVMIQQERIFSPVYDHVLLGVVSAAAFSIRTNGILLLGTMGIIQAVMLIRQFWQAKQHQSSWTLACKHVFSPARVSLRILGIKMLPYAAFLSLISVWQVVSPAGALFTQTLYLRSLSFPDIWSLVNYYIDLPAQFFVGAPHYYLFYGASLPLVIAGIFRRYKADFHMIVYVILTLMLYILWPAVQGLRFIFPILPFYLSFALTGVEMFEEQISGKEQLWRKIVCRLILGILLAAFGMQSFRAVQDNFAHNRASSSGPFVETSQQMFQFIREHVGAEETVVFFKPRVMRMLTGRRAFMLKSIEELSRNDYVCLYLPIGGSDQVHREKFASLVEHRMAERVYENRDFEVYRVRETFPFVREF